MASRTAWLPTGMMLGRPPRITGFSVSSSSGASSRPDAYGGQCRFRRHGCPDGTCPSISSICLPSSSSEHSRSVFHGVVGTTPRLAMVPRRDDAPHGGVEPLGGQVAPALHLRGDLVAEQLVERAGILLQPGQ